MGDYFSRTRPRFDTLQTPINHLTIDGVGHKFVEIPVGLMAQFPQGYDSNHEPFSFYESESCGNNKYIPFHGDLEYMFGELQKWKFPMNLIDEARALAIDLMYVLQAENNPRQVRRQVTGRFDTGRMSSVVRDLQMGRFSADYTRPFKKRLKGATSRPNVSIVVQGNPSFMWSDDNNIPNSVRAGLAIAWACQALDAPVNMFLASKSTSSSQLHYFQKIISNEDEINLHDLGVLLHRDLFRWGWGCALCHHKEISDLPGIPTNGGASFRAPTNAVTYARERYGANIVIAVGDDHEDANLADVVVTHNMVNKPKEIIAHVAKQLSQKLELKGIQNAA